MKRTSTPHGAADSIETEMESGDVPGGPGVPFLSALGMRSI